MTGATKKLAAAFAAANGFAWTSVLGAYVGAQLSDMFGFAIFVGFIAAILAAACVSLYQSWAGRGGRT